MHPSVHCSTIHNSQDMETNLNVHRQDEWIKKMWYIYTMEYYSAAKRNKIIPFTATGMQLHNIIRSEISQKEKDKGFPSGSVVKNHLQCRSCRRRGFDPCVRGIPWRRIMVTHSSKKKKNTNKIQYHLYVESKIWYKLTYLQNRDIENRLMVAKEERGRKTDGLEIRG